MKAFNQHPRSLIISTPVRYLVVAIAAIIVPMSLSQADVNNKQIGDLEVYQPAQAGSGTVMMMLDTSGSMGSSSISDDWNVTCNSIKTFSETFPFTDDKGVVINAVTNADGTITDTSKGITANYQGCSTTTYDRVSRLKQAMIGLLANGQSVSAKNKIGMGNFSANGDGTHGQVMVPAMELTPAQRLRLINYIQSLIAYNGTPSAQAFAEAGAYMMGTKTSDTVQDTRVIEKGAIVYTNSKYYLIPCQANYDTTNSDSTGLAWYSCYYPSNYPISQAIQSSTSINGLNLNLIGTTNYQVKSGNVYYLGNKKTGLWPANGYSGYGLSDDSTKKTDLSTYQTPITSAQCSGYGIYFLTDGAPNSSSGTIASNLMNYSLNSSNALTVKNVTTVRTYNNGSQGYVSDTDCNNGLSTYNEGGAWGCISSYAKLLNNTSNPSGRIIKTAAVGFGSDFVSLQGKTRNIQVKDDDGNLVTKAIPDCSQATTTDARNLCKLAELKSDPTSSVQSGGYGEGGFTATSSASEIASSLKNFIASLNNSTDAAPSGTIVVPDDPYKADSQLPVAYYPSLKPQLSSSSQFNAIWPGNMKKYGLDQGTLTGQNNQKLFLDANSSNTVGTVDRTTQDLWSDKDYPNANNAVTSGGMYAQLSSPTTTSLASARTVYIEDLTAVGATTTKLRKVGVNAAGKFTLDGAPLSSSNNFIDTFYTDTVLRQLLSYLGYTNLDTTTTVAKMTLTSASIPTSPIKVLGAAVHSAPAAVSYFATLDSNGRVTDNRDDYVLFGSMDGALHLVDADNATSAGGGKEKFAFIPKQMLFSQVEAIVPNGQVRNTTANPAVAGKPDFGIDAPWLVTADYKYDFPNLQVNVDTGNGKGVYAYGGLRMGGTSFYAMNLTDHDNPTLMYSLTPSSSGFSRMGQIWSKPTRAKIKTSSTDTTGTDVVIFGGGYDTCYENPNFQVGITDTALGSCSGKTSVQGNAVYMINAKTGALIWSASSDNGASTGVSSMKNSIVGGITALDRNNDGFMDNLYFADLGGQVFRADFTNASTTAGTSFSNVRVTRILKNAYDGTANAKYAYRFYERPIVSFYRNPKSNTLYALVNIISGDRSSPLSTLRSDLTYSDRLYGIMDTDITKSDKVFYASNFTDSTNPNGQKIVDLTDTNFSQLPTAMTADSTGFITQAQKTSAIDNMKSGGVKGWFYRLNRFDGYNNVPYNKGVGRSEVINNFLFTSVYNPNMSYGTTDSCTARIVGGTEREMYCLPYGICMDNTSKTGTGGFERAGKGIQELTLGPLGNKARNVRLLIGLQTLADRTKGRVDFNADTGKALGGTNGIGLVDTGLDAKKDQIGGDGSMAAFIFNERFALTPNTWFEVTK